MLYSTLNGLTEPHKAGESNSTDHSLERTLMTVSKDGLLDANCHKDNEEESSNCNECRLTDWCKYGKGYSEDVKQKINIDIGKFFIKLRCQNEGVRSVVQ